MTIQLLSLASLKDKVYVRLYSTNNNKVKEYMAQHGIEGTLRRKDTWIAILENMDSELAAVNQHYVEPVKTLSDDEFFTQECDKMGLDESEVLNVYPDKIEFLDDVIYKGYDYVCDYILSHRAKNEVIPYQVITTETTESVYTIPASQDVAVDPIADLLKWSYEVTGESYDHMLEYHFNAKTTLKTQGIESNMIKITKDRKVLRDGTQIGYIVGNRFPKKHLGKHSDFALILEDGTKISLDCFAYYKDVKQYVITNI